MHVQARTKPIEHELVAGLMLTATCMASLTPAPASEVLSKRDRHFVRRTVQNNTTQIKLGELAQQRASDKRVKSFAKKMQSAHSKYNSYIKHVAGSLPAQPASSAHNKHTVEELSKLNGQEFDKAYMKQIVRAHKDTIDALKAESEDGGCAPSLRKWSDKKIPKIQKHLETAEQINAGVNL